ncbi:hypothetical protein THRCLA_21435 [Thraustotheca clavata]|uniref:Uncharacterized protein n=1 Tax=Thraustotheca clavata TaxID=74557 RepID=A0A1V9ZWP7_9STRA|nr:hypothetical protein THRCLA_21435 [Thraustotheca clavata]
MDQELRLHKSKLAAFLRTWIGVCCVISCYIFDRLWHPKLQRQVLRTTLLNASSYYMFEMSSHIGMHLNNSSAYLAGILSFETRQYLHAFDTKSRRYIGVPISLTNQEDEKVHRIPLRHL